MKTYEHYAYNDTIIPDSQEVAIKVDGKVWNTYGNVSCFTGKPKSRKSTFGIGVLLAHQTGKEVFNISVNTAGKVIYIDTEQMHYDFYHTLQRIKAYANVDHLDAEKFQAFLFRMLDVEEILDNIEMILLSDPDVKILILDSITDLVNDINNILEAKTLVNRFKKWSNYGISIITILHLSKTNGYSLGHIGSCMERFSQSMSIVEKDPDNPYQSSCKSLYMRSDIDFKPFIVDFNDDGYDIKEPITKLSNKNVKPELIDIGIHKKHLSDIGSKHSKLSYSELINCLMGRYQKGESYIKRSLMPYLRDHSLVVQDHKRMYSIANLSEHINGLQNSFHNTNK